MKTLDEIGRENGTDKYSGANNFLTLYDAFLSPIRSNTVKVLEIGVLNGGSARTWEEYFSEGEVIGADFDPEAVQHQRGRIKIEIADQSKPEDLLRLSSLGPFDLVVDDGSHVWGHQILTLQHLFPSLKPGGLYFLEDLDTSYGRYTYDYRGQGGFTTAQYLQKLSDWVVGCRVLNFMEQSDPTIQRLWPLVETITFARGTSIIKRKRSMDEEDQSFVDRNNAAF